MKYLAIILWIILFITLASLLYYFAEPVPQQGRVVMTVNNRKVTDSMVSDGKERLGGWHEDRNDMLNSLAIRQLLIQEAQRRKIDREPAFRKALKDFYEQSLINVLVERRNSSDNVIVTKAEIAAFQAAFGKTYTFITGTSDSLHPAESQWKNRESVTQPFANLSSTLQPILAQMKPGEKRRIFDTSGDRTMLQLVSVSGATDPAQALPAAVVRKILTGWKQQQNMDRWMTGLLDSADITINDGQTATEQPAKEQTHE